MRVSHIAARTLRFYRQSSKPAEASIPEVLDSVIDLFERRLRDVGIIVERRYKSAAPLIGYVGELRQVFSNLLGQFHGCDTPRWQNLVACSELAALARWQAGVRGTIADTGHGMLTEVRKRIFEPFFATKDAMGAGLGL